MTDPERNTHQHFIRDPLPHLIVFGRITESGAIMAIHSEIISAIGRKLRSGETSSAVVKI